VLDQKNAHTLLARRRRMISISRSRTGGAKPTAGPSKQKRRISGERATISDRALAPEILGRLVRQVPNFHEIGGRAAKSASRSADARRLCQSRRPTKRNDL
jgi:hypothetical protein